MPRPSPGKLLLRVLTPAREVVSKEVDSANLPAAEGEVGILPGHAPLLAQLRPGVAQLRVGGQVESFALSDGFLEVSDDVVTALVRTAEPAGEIDVTRAEQRRLDREQELKRTDLSEVQMKVAELSMQKQLARIGAARIA